MPNLMRKVFDVLCIIHKFNNNRATYKKLQTLMFGANHHKTEKNKFAVIPINILRNAIP